MVEPALDTCSQVGRNGLSYYLADHWYKETSERKSGLFCMLCATLWAKPHPLYPSDPSNFTAMVQMLHKLSKCLLFWFLKDLCVWCWGKDVSLLTELPVSKPGPIHPPDDHGSEFSTFSLRSSLLVISRFSSRVILTMDYAVNNLSLYLHASRMTFLFVRGKKNNHGLRKRGSPWSSLTSRISFLLLRVLSCLNSLLSPFTKDSSIFRTCDATLFQFFPFHLTYSFSFPLSLVTKETPDFC